jgi:hypothetical protein
MVQLSQARRAGAPVLLLALLLSVPARGATAPPQPPSPTAPAVQLSAAQARYLALAKTGVARARRQTMHRGW